MSNNDDQIVDYDQLDAKIQQLIQAAVIARKNAYCPYSRFAVGAALRLGDGQICTGCNIENATHGPSICAERTAIAHAVCAGKRDLCTVAVVAFQEDQFTAPCGMCRQMLSEFGHPEMPIYMSNPEPGRVLCSTLGKLLPHAFKPALSLVNGQRDSDNIT